MRHLIVVCWAATLLAGACACAQSGVGRTPWDWHPDAASLCWWHPSSTVVSAETRFLAQVVELVGLDPVVGAPLLEVLRAQQVPICIEHRHHHDFGAYDATYGMIALNDTLGVAEAAIIVVHEARHVDRAAKGFAPSLSFAMEDAARMTRVLEADAQAVATRFAWDVRGIGRRDVWAALMGFEHYADIGQAFENAVLAGSGPERAMGAAFAGWFASSWRVDTYTRAACWAYLDELDATKLLPSRDHLPHGTFDDLCALPAGGSYPCTVPPLDP